MPSKRRKTAEVHTIECDVQLGQPLSCEVAATVSQDICKHILFMRNQIPKLYNELAGDAEECSAGAAKGRRSGKKRKVDKFIAAADELLSSLSPELFSACQDTEVVFVLGPSPMRALETYSLACSASANDEGSALQGPAASAAAASRAVLRKLILSTAAGPEGPASRGATKLIVLVRRPALAEPPAGFLPKRGLQLRMRKGLQVKISVTGPEQGSARKVVSGACQFQASEMSWSQAGCCSGQQKTSPEKEHQGNSAEESGDDWIWYQSTVSLKGITEVSSQPMDLGAFM